MVEFPVVETEGTPYEIGLQHGRKAQKQIRACFERLCPVGERTQERRQHAGEIERQIAERMPAALEEMHGIADGARQPYEDILLMNLSVELWQEDLYMPRRNCTIIGVAGAEPLVAKTIDVSPGDDRYIICHQVKPQSGYDFLHLTYAGTVWTDGGVNGAGLAQSNSSLESNQCNWAGFPVFIMARYLLQTCSSVSEALSVAECFEGINSGGNVLLGDSSGDFVVLEKTVSQAVRRLKEDTKADGQVGEIIFATNHSVTEEMEPLLGGSEALLTNSRHRFDNLTVLARDVKRDLEGTFSFLRNHTSPGGLCQHGQGALHTVGAFVGSPKRAMLWIARGYPCESEFASIKLCAATGEGE